MLDEQLIARVVRASRVRLGLRQSDLAASARVSRDVVSKVENGRLASVRIPDLDRVAAACRLRLRVELVAARGDLDRLADGAHAYLVERIAALLEQSGWEIVLEAQTARGSVDVLAFHRHSRMLLVVEVKSRLVDLQGTVRTLGRVAAEAASTARRLGWHQTATSVLLVVGDSTTQRSVVERHRATVAIAFPMRTRRT